MRADAGLCPAIFCAWCRACRRWTSWLAPLTRHEAARAPLDRLGIPARLQAVPPAVFLGDEQQRIDWARGFLCRHPVLLLDGPTVYLDAARRDVIIGLIAGARARGTAIVGIFHDHTVRAAVADRVHTVAVLQETA